MSTGRRGEGRGQMWLPRAIAVLGDHLFVADTFNHRVVKFSRKPANALRWRHQSAFGGYGSGRTQLNKPWGLCLLEGHLLIVDRNNHRLVLTTVAGRHVRTIGGAGLAPGRFRYPCAACVAHGSWFEKPSALA
eukprot:Transcript_6552.p3 GENE.Transcript_6552~~Transcript_6552.p3  ORF type:complete len:133 (+),score=51.13 Transcript_6552:753-1151(+)